jgi:thiamine biosynthesis lipoprotein
MDTLATITVYSESDKPAVGAAVAKLQELDGIFDYYNPDSELSRINRTAGESPVLVSRYMGELIAESLRLCELTGGAFDISLGLLIEQGEIAAELLSNLGYENILYENGTVFFTNKSVKMHFGAVAKGFALDKVIEILTEQGVTSAIIDIGGEIGVIGRSQREHGIWRVGIKDPYNPGEIAQVYDLTKGVMATSGDYERGEHIFDRTTGRSADSGLTSVTVIVDAGEFPGTFADAVSTAIFVKGIDESAYLIEKAGVNVVYFRKES